MLPGAVVHDQPPLNLDAGTGDFQLAGHTTEGKSFSTGANRLSRVVDAGQPRAKQKNASHESSFDEVGVTIRDAATYVSAGPRARPGGAGQTGRGRWTRYRH